MEKPCSLCWSSKVDEGTRYWTMGVLGVRVQGNISLMRNFMMLLLRSLMVVWLRDLMVILLRRQI